MKIAIADDEAPARERLRRLLDEIGGHEIVGEAADGRSALLLAERVQPEVMLLDIRMPGMDGLEVARHLALFERPPAVVFTTAYDSFALKAFETGAIAYLVKPVRRERLAQALVQAVRLTRAQLAALASQEALPARRRHICARLRGRLELVALEEVLYFRADLKYVTVRHLRGEVLIEESLKALEREFGDEFVRVHRNALAALRHIAALERDAAGHFRLRLRGCEETLEVSRRLAAEVKQRIRSA